MINPQDITNTHHRAPGWRLRRACGTRGRAGRRLAGNARRAAASSVTASTCDIPCRSTQCEPKSGGAANAGAARVGAIGFSAGGHLAGLAALATELRRPRVTSTSSCSATRSRRWKPRPIGRRGSSCSARTPHRSCAATPRWTAFHPSSPPFFIWHTAEDIYVPPEHTYRLAATLAANDVAHAVHVFATAPHSLGLAQRRRRGCDLDDPRGVLDHRAGGRARAHSNPT